MTYVRGHPRDERTHARAHSEYMSGPRIPAVSHAPEIGRIDEYTVHIVDRNVAEAQRKKLAHVAMVACREMHFPAGYDGTLPDPSLRLFVVTKAPNVVAMAITQLESESTFWKLGWNPEGSLVQLEPQPTIAEHQTVSRIWTASGHRRRGLAFRLIDHVARHLHVPPTQLGWEMPFTKAGARIVRRLCPEVVWGRGDWFALERTLKADGTDV